nr:uncharacterized protein LOC108396271 isoform X4 [Manis javanica]
MKKRAVWQWVIACAWGRSTPVSSRCGLARKAEEPVVDSLMVDHGPGCCWKPWSYQMHRCGVGLLGGLSAHLPCGQFARALGAATQEKGPRSWASPGQSSLEDTSPPAPEALRHMICYGPGTRKPGRGAPPTFFPPQHPGSATPPGYLGSKRRGATKKGFQADGVERGLHEGAVATETSFLE